MNKGKFIFKIQNREREETVGNNRTSKSLIDGIRENSQNIESIY